MTTSVEHIQLLGRKWMPSAPGFAPPHDSHVFQLGVLGHCLFSSDYASLILRSTFPSGSTPGQQTMNLEGAAIQQHFLTENGPSFFVPPDLDRVCSDPRTLEAVTGEDLKRRYRFSMLVFPPGHYVLMAFMEPNDVMRLRIAGIPELSSVFVQQRSLVLLSYDADGALTTMSRILRPGKSLRQVVESPSEDTSLRCDQEYCVRTLTRAFNILLFQQSYPEYLDVVGTRCGYRQRGEHASTPQVYLFKPRSLPLRQVVEGGAGPATVDAMGRKQRPHFRPGHWRRQPHGERFHLMNPDVIELYFPDGRAYHMKFIELYGVNFQ